ncbi:ABC transporter ATP-binding protein [Lysinibacter cavernae]|uniref:ABC-type glutathione transport system ATPase component n=1 Tax=Lysinibacter cavernae TaxID=1640652 RepID=A0A7X5TS28_9MICO|nr:dipeptide/oligopeptide/nickel ABC transporter ATP-binding protein [Lysinibacter cavernae]NIH52986.1 ABC-type glutathione transport system ATPase component [Lysinibacter cavernae]
MIDRNPHGSDDIIVSDLSISYPAHGGSAQHQAIEGVSFSVPKGAVCGLLGESGSGKSTLAKVIAARGNEVTQRTVQPVVNSGAAIVLGQNVVKLSKRKRSILTAEIGYLGQADGATLPPDRTVADCILEPIAERDKRFDRQQIGLVIAELMDQVALPLTMLHTYPHELSKGQRQRVAIVRALVMQPRMLVADEPTLGVDVANRPRVVDMLDAYRTRHNATMLLVSHDITVLERLVDELIVLQSGSLVGRGTIEEVFSQTNHTYVQRLAAALRATAYDELAIE